MTKEMFKEWLEKCGGVENLLECKEAILNESKQLVDAIDEVVELVPMIDSDDIREQEILEKTIKMVALMKNIVD